MSCTGLCAFDNVHLPGGLSIVTFSIAWTLTRDFLGATLIGATHPDQLDDVIAAAEAKIPPEALNEVDKISREIRHPMG